LDEQLFLVNTINKIQNLPQWNDISIIITYDDSGGWYDHVMPPIISQSNDKANDMLLDKSGQLCGHAEKEKEAEEKKQKRLRSLSPYAQAFQMFKDKRLLADVAIELDIKTNAVLDFYGDYLRLVRMDHLVSIYHDLKDNWSLFLHLYNRIKIEGLDKHEITDLVENEQRLVDLEQRVRL
jgi:phosphoesterase family protein